MDELEELLREKKGSYGHDDLAKALHIATEKGRLECVQLLLRYGALPNAHDSSGYTPLIIAARHGHTDVLQALIQAGCNVNKPTFR